MISCAGKMGRILTASVKSERERARHTAIIVSLHEEVLGLRVELAGRHLVFLPASHNALPSPNLGQSSVASCAAASPVLPAKTLFAVATTAPATSGSGAPPINIAYCHQPVAEHRQQRLPQQLASSWLQPECCHRCDWGRWWHLPIICYKRLWQSTGDGVERVWFLTGVAFGPACTVQRCM